jgi:glycosyltransferase involved in cell wall biosynthesis
MQSSLKMDKPIFVSISCITYNHEKFIRQCIEGFLMQKTNFPIEILIFDDASTDGAQQIIQEYASKDHRIITFLQNENQWSKGKYGLLDWLFPAAKGKYIALCEGDDYWTDPLKLQKQVDFLEANPEYVLCFHKVSLLEGTTFKEDNIISLPDNYEDIATFAKKGNYIHTPSIVFKNIIPKLPAEFKYSPIGDFFLSLLLAEGGKIKRLNDVMAVYRLNSGIWSEKSNYYRNFKTALTHALLYKYFNKKNNTVIASILLERIQSFIETFSTEINEEEIEELIDFLTEEQNNTELKGIKSILFTLHKSLLPARSIQNIGTKQLLKIIFSRIKQKLISL